MNDTSAVGDRIEIIPDDNEDDFELRERLEAQYEDVTLEAARQLRRFDKHWAVNISDDGTETDLLKDIFESDQTQ